MKKQTVYDIEEYTARARQALETMRKTQQPGERTGKGKKTDVLMAIRGEIEKLIKAGYTSHQIADALKNNDVFAILPKTITQLIRTGEEKKEAKKQRKTKQKAEPKTETQAARLEKQNTQQNAGTGTFKVRPDTENL